MSWVGVAVHSVAAFTGLEVGPAALVVLAGVPTVALMLGVGMVELMERRMETVKKQADTITELENELAKARKQERAYEEAMEQLQADLDALEQDNAKLKTLAAHPERQPTAAQAVEAESVPAEGNLETSYLLEQVSHSQRTMHSWRMGALTRARQIDALRGTVRFLRNENSFLPTRSLLRSLDLLQVYVRYPFTAIDDPFSSVRSPSRSERIS